MEPRCSEPHRWIGGYDHLKLALELDSGDHVARRKLIICLLGVGTHQLPDVYVGDRIKTSRRWPKPKHCCKDFQAKTNVDTGLQKSKESAF